MGGAASAVSNTVGAVGAGVGGVANQTRGFVGGITGSKIFGNGEDPGLLGTGLYNPEKYEIDENPFKDSGLYDNRRSEFAKQLAATQGRSGVAIDQGASNQIRGRQLTLADQLTAQAEGRGPSLATLQLKQATDRNLAQAMAMAATQRGAGGGGLALRNVQNQQSQIASQAARDSALARMQEQLDARNQLAGVLNQTRGIDASLASQQAQLEQEQRAQNDAMSRFYNQGMMDLDLKQREALMGLQKLKADQQLGYEGIKSGSYANAAQARGNLSGGILQGAGAALAMSDKTKKTNIKSADKDLQSFFKHYAKGGLCMADGGEVPGEDEEKKKEKSTFEKSMEAYGLANKEMAGGGKYAGQAQAGQGIGKAVGSAFVSKPQKKPDTSKMVDTEAFANQPGTMTANQGGLVGDNKELLKYLPLAMMAMSDKNEKKNIQNLTEGGKVEGRAQVKGDSLKNDTVPAMLSPGEVVLPRTVVQSGDDNKVLDFLNGIKAYKYNYKDPKHGDGTYISPMAQDLEKTELGKDMIVDTPEGKMVDYARGAGTYLAAAANLNKRLSEVESKLSQGPKHMAGGGEVTDEHKTMAYSVKNAFKAPGPKEVKEEDKEQGEVPDSYKRMAAAMRKAFGGL